MQVELQKREAAHRAIAVFCASEGFDVPDLEEESFWRNDVRVTTFIGDAPDGRRFGIGYEMTLRELTKDAEAAVAR